MKFKGSCLCGKIEYEVDEFSSEMGHCHCSMCRKFHGAAFATLGEASKQNFRWLKGESQLQSFTADNGTTRQFCKVCGSSLSFSASGNDDSIIEISLGTLDTPISTQADAHIFVNSKADWYHIEDDLPQFSAGRIKST